MFGKLTASEIDHVVRGQSVGRLGVVSDDRVYIFPVSYGYDGAFFYVASPVGLKVRLMRRRPEVCFEVEEILSPAWWRTVIVHGTYEELQFHENREYALRMIAGQGVRAPFGLAASSDGAETTVYRIRVREMTGRFERGEVTAGGRARPPGTGGVVWSLRCAGLRRRRTGAV